MTECQALLSMTRIFLCLSLAIYPHFAQPNEASNRLYSTLQKNYNKMIRGERDMRKITKLYFTFNLIRITEFDELDGRLSLVGFFALFWIDGRMKWTPAQYNNTNTIIFNEKDVWRPLIFLASPQKEFKRLGNNNFFIRYNASGRAEWYPGDIWASSCTPDVYKYPYDTQSCLVSFAVWGYSSAEVMLKSLDNKVRLHVYSPHGTWDLIDTLVLSNVDTRGLVLMNITLVMERISTFHMINMILPIVFVGLLNILVFLLPAQSGERVGYSITVLLAIAVFQTIASDNLPSVSKPKLSLLCIKLLADLILSALVMTLTIITLYFYHMPESRRVPSCIAAITRFVLCRTCRNKANDTTKDKYDEYIIGNGFGVTESVSDSGHHQTEVTWTDVGKSSDVVFTAFSILTFLGSNVLFMVYIAF
ncbi:neuronal acetylcholine receptor subunit alpha-7-like [Saccostrea echinata]|uniref:neuronal acetylcholine receptor subunit alpha-7-like n=1 Tax=Saccostrea echinata TaxID=191078 RepID=UPI002A81F225|nr:neuronal acetylcholine receptor subunit alpha-7-like [Saccostrea echinata]